MNNTPFRQHLVANKPTNLPDYRVLTKIKFRQPRYFFSMIANDTSLQPAVKDATDPYLKNIMRIILLILAGIIYLNTSFGQIESFSLLKYKIPQGWQQQSRLHLVSYSGIETASNTPLEIVVYENQPAAIKPDSSFRREWRRILNDDYGSPAVPFAKKSYNSGGLQFAVNTSKPVEVITNNQKRYTQLVVFIFDKQMQAMQFITNNPADYKVLRPFVDDFIDTVDTIEKRNE